MVNTESNQITERVAYNAVGEQCDESGASFSQTIFFLSVEPSLLPHMLLAQLMCLEHDNPIRLEVYHSKT